MLTGTRVRLIQVFISRLFAYPVAGFIRSVRILGNCCLTPTTSSGARDPPFARNRSDAHVRAIFSAIFGAFCPGCRLVRMAFERERLANLSQVVMIPLSRRRSLVALGSACAAPMILVSLGQAQTILPDRPLRLLVGFAAGGGSELMARAIAPTLERRLGRRVTVENKRTGPGNDAGEFFKKDLEQGLAVAFMPTTTLAPKLAGSSFPFDSQSTLVPLTTAVTFQVALAVPPHIGVSTFAEYVAWVKANPSERRSEERRVGKECRSR